MNEELKYLSDEEIIEIMTKFIENINSHNASDLECRNDVIDKYFWELS